MINYGIRRKLKTLYDLNKIIFRVERSFVPLSLVRSIIKAVIPIINVVLPKYIIDEMLGLARQDYLIFYILLIAGNNFVFGFMQIFFSNKWELANKKLQHGMEIYLGSHIMNMDYSKLEDPDILDMKERALYPIKMQNSLNELIENVCSLFTVVITLFSLVVIILQANILLLIGILFFNGINFLLFQIIQKNYGEFYEQIPVTMRKSIYFENITTDYKSLKEIQIYKAKTILLEELKQAHNDNIKLFQKVFYKNGNVEGWMGIVTQIQRIFVYVFNIWTILQKRITFGEFTMYINAATKLEENITIAINSIILVHQNCNYLETYLQFLDIQSDCPDDGISIKERQNFIIEFRHVFFHYPNQQEDILKDITMKISPGEKISIVGMNGAGKTTFIKLLCRLFKPTQGAIYLNNINIEEYSMKEYMEIISTVFQDFKLLDLSFKDNIDFNHTGGDAMKCIHEAGLYEKIQKCPEGIETEISKHFNQNGIELSGGEGQKLAIARAIYKNSPILILDEPTSALDPYTENEIYRKFDEISKNKTVIYISHRLSSCLLCDKIYVFEQGKIVEQGSHEVLLKNDKLYKQLWDAQAQYYNLKSE